MSLLPGVSLPWGPATELMCTLGSQRLLAELQYVEFTCCHSLTTWPGPGVHWLGQMASGDEPAPAMPLAMGYGAVSELWGVGSGPLPKAQPWCPVWVTLEAAQQTRAKPGFSSWLEKREGIVDRAGDCGVGLSGLFPALLPLGFVTLGKPLPLPGGEAVIINSNGQNWLQKGSLVLRAAWQGPGQTGREGLPVLGAVSSPSGPEALFNLPAPSLALGP